MTRVRALAVLPLMFAAVACVIDSQESVQENEPTAATSVAALTATWLSTHRVCQLTGDTDLGTPGSAGSATGMVRGGGSRGITGTDIGWAFEHGGRLHFMFGDTRDFDRDRCGPTACGTKNTGLIPVPPPQPHVWTDWGNSNQQDLSNPSFYLDWLDTHGDSAESWASIPVGADPANCFALQVATDSTGNHRSTLFNGNTLPRQEGFFSGFSDGTNMLGFATLKTWSSECIAAGPDAGNAGCAHDNDAWGGRTALTLSRDNGASFDEIVEFSDTFFQFVAPNVVSGQAYPQLPSGLSSKNVLFAFGAGRPPRYDGASGYQKWNTSLPYLAVADVSLATAKTPTNGVAAYAHTIASGNQLSDPIALGGPFVGLAPEDKRILPYGDKVLVVRSDGYVWSQTVSVSAVGPYTAIPPRTQSNGYVPLVATGSGDKWVLPDPARGRLLVVTSDGRVFAHPITDHVEAPYQLTTMAPVADHAEDRWLFVVRDRLVVITKRGIVYGHSITGTGGNTIAAPTMLSAPISPTSCGPTCISSTISPATPIDKWVFAMDDDIITVTGTGEVYATRIAPNHVNGQPDVSPAVGWPAPPTYPKVGWSDNDRWLVPIHPTAGGRLLLDITYRPTAFSYFTGLDGNYAPTWGGTESLSKPLWTDDACVGYYSVRYLQPANVWLAMYTCHPEDTQRRGIYLRTASQPWGPWSAPVEVVNMTTTGAGGNPYCEYMYLPGGPCPSGPNPFENEKRADDGGLDPGGEYAPFLLPSGYQKYVANGTSTLYFTLSTTDPYQTSLLATHVTLH